MDERYPFITSLLIMGRWVTISAMVQQLAGIFLSVIAPVFGLVLIGYMAGPRLQLDARTLSRLLNLSNDLVFLYTLSLS